MKKIALFNHKGGVGKTTLAVNLASAFEKNGHRVLIVDADPQCNATAFFLDERYLDGLLDESADVEEGQTLWSAVYPVVRGKGDVKVIPSIEVWDERNVFLAPGDVLLSRYEEDLSLAWLECLASKERGFDISGALGRVVDVIAADVDASLVIYDMGPNVGPLNRIVLLDSDYIVLPVAADLFSLRALRTVGDAIIKWLNEWRRIEEASGSLDDIRLLSGKPKILGYVSHQYNVYRRTATGAFAEWERKIKSRVSRDLVEKVRESYPELVPSHGNKLGEIKNYHSLAPAAQMHGRALGDLRGLADHGYNDAIAHANNAFSVLSRAILSRMD